jgi:ABC-2 type transport system permease protein
MKLLQIEWLKIRKYSAFWWMMAIVTLTYPGVNYMFYTFYNKMLDKGDPKVMIIKALIGDPFAFHEAWHTVAYLSSMFIMVPAIMIIMLITNEYQYKTHRQNIIDGWSRQEFMIGKLLDVVLITMLVTFMYVLVVLGFGWFSGAGFENIFEKSNYILLFMLQTFAQLSIAFLLGFLLRKAFIALGAFLFYVIVIENVAIGIARVNKVDVGKFFPVEITDRIIPPPAFIGKFDEASYKASLDAVNHYILATIAIVAVIWISCFIIYKKRDL